MVHKKKWFTFWDGHAEDPLGFMVLLWRIFPVKGYGDKLLFFFFFCICHFGIVRYIGPWKFSPDGRFRKVGWFLEGQAER